MNVSYKDNSFKHVRAQEAEMPFECTECGKLWRYREEACEHKLTHIEKKRVEV